MSLSDQIKQYLQTIQICVKHSTTDNTTPGGWIYSLLCLLRRQYTDRLWDAFRNCLIWIKVDLECKTTFKMTIDVQQAPKHHHVLIYICSLAIASYQQANLNSDRMWHKIWVWYCTNQPPKFPNNPFIQVYTWKKAPGSSSVCNSDSNIWGWMCSCSIAESLSSGKS